MDKCESYGAFCQSEDRDGCSSLGTLEGHFVHELDYSSVVCMSEAERVLRFGRKSQAAHESCEKLIFDRRQYTWHNSSGSARTLVCLFLLDTPFDHCLLKHYAS